jgi:hypothetical protein
MPASFAHRQPVPNCRSDDASVEIYIEIELTDPIGMPKAVSSWG